MNKLQVTPAGKDHEGRVIVRLQRPDTETFYAVINDAGACIEVFDTYWLPW